MENLENKTEDNTISIKEVEENSIHNMAACMLSILDSLKLADKGYLDKSETLSEIMFRKMKGYNVDLNKELGFTHLKPVLSSEKVEEKMYSKEVILNTLTLNSLREKFHSNSGMFLNKKTSIEIINWIKENL